MKNNRKEDRWKREEREPEERKRWGGGMRESVGGNDVVQSKGRSGEENECRECGRVKKKGREKAGSRRGLFRPMAHIGDYVY